MTKKRFISLFLIIAFCTILIVKCDDTITQEDLDNKIIPSSNVSYSQHIQPIFDAKCNYAGCHNDRDLAGGLSLTNYYNTIADYLIVAPGLPDNSKLVWAIEGRGTNPMPPVGRWPLTKNQIQGIRTWIKEGAKNN